MSDYCHVCGFDTPSCVCLHECEGDGDDCTRIATTTRDTSDGWLSAKRFCANCAADYDRFVNNYDGPNETFDDALGAVCDRMLRDTDARRLK